MQGGVQLGLGIVVFFWAVAGAVAGAILFLLLAAAIRVLRVKNKRAGYSVSAFVSVLLAIGIAAAPNLLMTASGLISSNPVSDFRLVFKQDPPKSVVILKSHSSAGTDYLHATVEFKIPLTDLLALVTDWKPGEIPEDQLPGDDDLSAHTCMAEKSFLNQPKNPNVTDEYSAVLFCPRDSTALAVYSKIE